MQNGICTQDDEGRDLTNARGQSRIHRTTEEQAAQRQAMHEFGVAMQPPEPFVRDTHNRRRSARSRGVSSVSAVVRVGTPPPTLRIRTLAQERAPA